MQICNNTGTIYIITALETRIELLRSLRLCFRQWGGLNKNYHAFHPIQLIYHARIPNLQKIN